MEAEVVDGEREDGKNGCGGEERTDHGTPVGSA
jgi:hypothetical protein